MDESALIAHAKRGDLDSFNRLVLEYQDLVFNVTYRMLNEPATAEDITQDAFVSAYKKLHTFRGGSFKAWLLRIATNACYDELRRQKRRPTVPLEPLGEDQEEIESPVWLADPGELPEDAAARAELARAIQRCMDQLAAEFRHVVILVDIQGLGYAEAAEAIRKPLGTVKSRLARARVGMQDCLQGFRELLPAQFRLEEERI
ncbi:MAG: sigma-70 family RNA polymerase sigma factor [Anaerolineae bacterium]|nr:sigma-70 family RNA polymerase sigma factor [Anaerolineae bacterium]